MRPLAPAALVLGGVLAFEVGYGVSPGDAVLYLGYELTFVLGPGWLAYRALSDRPGSTLRQLAVGWALGYVLEILAFMATAAIGIRQLFDVYPFLVAVVAVVVIRRRNSVTCDSEKNSTERKVGSWTIASACLVAVSYIALAYFPTSTLPGTESVTYFPDYPRWIALAADAKHHWPIMDPSVSGEPLPYHYFVNIHLAASSQVTGLGLPLIFFRLFILPLVVVSVLLLVVAGEVLAGSRRVGLLAAGIAFLVGELRLDASSTFLAHTPFFGLFFTLLFRSPSFLLGLVLFIALMILLGEQLRRGSAKPRIGDWTLIAIFMVGASDAKVTILPLVLASLIVYSVWALASSRRIPVAAWLAGVTALVTLAVLWGLQYKGHSSGLGVHPFADVRLMPAVQIIRGDLMANLAGFPGKETLLDVGGILFGLAGLLAAPLIGIAWIVRKRDVRGLKEPEAWRASILVAGVAVSFVFAEPGTQSGMYFLFYGLVGGYLLSAQGLMMALQSRPLVSGQRIRALVLGAMFAVLIGLLIWLPSAADLFQGPRVVALTYMFRYGGLLLALLLLFMGGTRWLRVTAGGGAALASIGLLAIGALATPLDNLRPAIANGSESEGLGSIFKPMSPDLYGALAWIRDETESESIIAVNNQWINTENTVPLAFNYSAFSERRVFLEGWGYSQRTRDLGFATVGAGANPFEDRLTLSRAAFTEADPDALRSMVDDFGVHYLVVDEINGYPADLAALEQQADVVYEAPGVVVLRLKS